MPADKRNYARMTYSFERAIKELYLVALTIPSLPFTTCILGRKGTISTLRILGLRDVRGISGIPRSTQGVLRLLTWWEAAGKPCCCSRLIVPHILLLRFYRGFIMGHMSSNTCWRLEKLFNGCKNRYATLWPCPVLPNSCWPGASK